MTAHPVTTPTEHKVAFGVMEFCQATSLKRAKVYQLCKAGDLSFVKCGTRTLITTSPAEFIAGLAGNKMSVTSQHADVAA